MTPPLTQTTVPPKNEKTTRAAAATSLNVLRSDRGVVRPLEEKDLNSVARLFLLRFRPHAVEIERAHTDVIDYMRQLYLSSRDIAAGEDSLVQVNGRGEIVAFAGVIRTTYLIDGEPIAAGIVSALMTSPDAGNGLAVIQLLGALHRGSLDFVFTDSANRESLEILRAMKYAIIHPNSLEWACIFQPAAATLHKMRQKWPMTPTTLLGPFARIADFIAERVMHKKLKLRGAGSWRDEAIDVERFVELAPQFLGEARLRPEWSPRELGWLTTQALMRRGAGPLRFHVVCDESNSPVGCYAFYGAKGDVARVIHVGASSKAWGGVLAKVMETANSAGCIGVHGCAREEMMSDLYVFRGVFFYYAGGTALFSKNANVLRAVRDRSTFLGGFAGDQWTRLATDEFGEQKVKS